MAECVAVTGATGYIGGRLVPRLLRAGFRVRCLVRTPRKLEGRSWSQDPRVEVVECDIADIDRTARSIRDCSKAFYLVHSMVAAGKEYADIDRQLAEAFARACSAAAVERILYLGGLGETGPGLSEHLASRREVEAALSSTAVPVTALRAAMIIGSGSASFEILRYLVERLPVMITPRWVRTKCQPIAVRDVLNYLVAALQEPATVGKTFDIGGPDVLSYLDIIQLMAELRGLRRRLVVPVPVLTPRLSSLWIHLVTPMSARIARPLAEGLRNEVICRDAAANQAMPIPLLTATMAIEAALGRHEAGDVESRWSDAGIMPGDPNWAGGTVFTDPRSQQIDASARDVFQAVCRIGGGHGWYGAQWLWRLRGTMDKLAGGPGLRRGRRNPEKVSFGEALDFWRVTGLEEQRRLELRAEMKLPGVATLSFEIEDDGQSGRGCRLVQTARFRPKGLFGLIYWYSVLPLHGWVFKSMLRGIKRTAETAAVPRDGPPAVA